MKAKDFAVFIEAYSDILDNAGAHTQARAWRALRPVFEASPGANVSRVCRAIGTAAAGEPENAPEEIPDGGVRTRVLIDAIPPLERCLQPWTRPRDIALLAAALTPHAARPVEDLAKAVRARLVPVKSPSSASAPRRPALNGETVEHYLRLLEESFRDEEKFPQVFRTLEKDRSVKAAEAKALARKFAGAAARSRGDALFLIWSRHGNLLGIQARAQATAGRTAA